LCFRRSAWCRRGFARTTYTGSRRPTAGSYSPRGILYGGAVSSWVRISTSITWSWLLYFLIASSWPWPKPSRKPSKYRRVSHCAVAITGRLPVNWISTFTCMYVVSYEDIQYFFSKNKNARLLFYNYYKLYQNTELRNIRIYSLPNLESIFFSEKVYSLCFV